MAFFSRAVTPAVKPDSSSRLAFGVMQDYIPPEELARLLAAGGEVEEHH